MVGIETAKDFPVFIPPRKRSQLIKNKSKENPNYVDHIVIVQVKLYRINTEHLYFRLKKYIFHKKGNKSTTTRHSPTSPNIDDCLLKNSLLLSKSSEKSASENRLSADVHSLLTYRGLNSTTNNFYDTDDHPKLQEPADNAYNSSNVTPSSYSESSLEAKLSRSQDCLTAPLRSLKKRVNIQTEDILDRTASTMVQYHRRSPESIMTTPNYENLESGETSIFNAELDHVSNSFEKMKTDSYLTMTGTVKRGRKKGQSVDLQLNISREELEQINASALMAVEKTAARNRRCCECSSTSGVHIVLLSLLCLPFVAITSSVYSFYIGTLTWYNMFNYFNEEKTYWHKLFLSPLLIVSYPICIVLCTVGLGLYAGLIQISIEFNRWINEISDIEKGFYGWLCGVLHLSDCSPYEVVILMDLRLPDEPVRGQSSTEELSL